MNNIVKDSIFNIDYESYKLWKSEMKIPLKIEIEKWKKNIQIIENNILEIEASKYEKEIEDWFAKNNITSSYMKSSIALLAIKKYRPGININILLTQSFNELIISQTCSCGGTINVHTKDCAEYQDPYAGMTEYLDPGESYPLGMVNPHNGNKCVCGAESIGVNNHSAWCPKHEAV